MAPIKTISHGYPQVRESLDQVVVSGKQCETSYRLKKLADQSHRSTLADDTRSRLLEIDPTDISREDQIPMDYTNHRFELNNGDSIPAIGLGTWQSAESETRNAVKHALQHGYRHIDTALNYGNEKEVGEGITQSGIPREQIWVTTKLDNHWHHRVHDGFEQSLSDLGIGYIDLYLIHFPCSTDPNDRKKHLEDWDFVKTWQDMQKLIETGKVKNIGVSNFQIQHLERLLNDPSCAVVPAVNQLELHPYNPSTKLLEYCQSKAIHCTAYSCLGGSTSSPINNHTDLVKNSVVLEIAKQRRKTPAQILLKWGLQRGTSVIPKSVTPQRIDSNYDLDGWELSKDEQDQISGITTRQKVVGDSWMPIQVFFGNDE